MLPEFGAQDLVLAACSRQVFARLFKVEVDREGVCDAVTRQAIRIESIKEMREECRISTGGDGCSWQSSFCVTESPSLPLLSLPGCRKNDRSFWRTSRCPNGFHRPSLTILMRIRVELRAEKCMKLRQIEDIDETIEAIPLRRAL